MHKRSRLPSLGHGHQSASSSTSAINRSQRGQAEEDDDRDLGHARGVQQNTTVGSGIGLQSAVSSSEGREQIVSHQRSHDSRRYHAEGSAGSQTIAQQSPLLRSSTRPLPEVDERRQKSHEDRLGRGSNRSTTLDERFLSRGAVAPPFSSSGTFPKEGQNSNTSSTRSAPKAPSPEDCSRQPSPVRSSTAEPSSVTSGSRCSSTTQASYVDPQQLSCPAPPPEVAALSSHVQPARSRALIENRTGSRTPDLMRSRMSSRHTTPDNASSRCLTPDPSYSGSVPPVESSSRASSSRDPRSDMVLPISRCGWSGVMEGDQDQSSTPVSPYRSPQNRSKPLPPLNKHPKLASISTGGSEPSTPTSLPGTPNAPHSERRRRPHRLPTGESIRSGGVSDSEPSSPDKSRNKKGSTASSSTSEDPKHHADSRASMSLDLNQNSTARRRSSVSTNPSNHLRPKMRNPRQQLRNGSRDDSFLSTISESTRSSDSTSTDEKQQRDSKITVLDGSQIEVFSASPSGDSRTQVDVLKDFGQLFQRDGDATGEQMQRMLKQYGFDKPLEMQRRVVPLVMSAFRDEQKSFITVQGAPQCGKTSALVLGVLGAVGAEMGGIRVVALSTGSTKDFKKYFDICSEVHPLRLECYEGAARKVSFAGLPPDPDSALVGVDPLEDLQRLSTALGSGAPAMVFGHPSRVLPLLREAPSWGIDLSNVQVLALDDAEETICTGLMDEVCEVCTILRHFSKQRLRHLILSHFLSHEAKSMIRCLRNSLLRQQNLFGIRAHRTQARAKSVNHYYAVAPRARWPAMLAVLHHALSLPSGIIFDDASPEARAQARVALRAQGVTASVWNALQEQGSGARAAARDGAAVAPRGPAFHLMPSDLVVLKVDLPQVRCVLHFEVPRKELSIYGLRLMCLEQQDQKKAPRKGAPGGRSLSVLFVEEEEVVRELEKTFHIQMQEVPTEMLVA